MPHRPQRHHPTRAPTSVVPDKKKAKTRKSKMWTERQKMLETYTSIHNPVPELPTKEFDFWEDCITKILAHSKKLFLRFRVRDSESVATHNRYVLNSKTHWRMSR